MAENETPLADGQAGDKQVLLSRIYIKDCSFESPRAPAVFAAPVVPEVKVNMRTTSQLVGGNDFEVTLSITAEATTDNRTVFLVEIHQAGLFTVRGFDERELAAILGSYCPGILFPYARAVVSDLVMKGGMPMLLLQPVNFDAVYAQSLGVQMPADKAAAG